MVTDLMLGIISSLALAALIFKKLRDKKKRGKTEDKGRKRLPPGPKAAPLFGNLFQLGKKPHLTLMKWKKIYGNIVFCRFGSYPTVVLMDSKLIKQAFSMPALAPRAKLKSSTKGTQRKGILFSEGTHNGEQRQFALRNLKDFGMGKSSIESKIQEDLLIFLDNIKENEGRPLKSTRLTNIYVVNTLWKILMTDHLDSKKAGKLAEIVQEKINKLGSFLQQLAMFTPWLEKLSLILTFGTWSLIKFKVKAFRELYGFMDSLISQKSRKPRDSFTNGPPQDLTDVYLDKVENTVDVHSSFHKNHNVSGHFLGDLFIGGVETSSTTLEWTFDYMARFPKVQQKLQDEIDRVIGPGRLPSLDDKVSMPYAEAVIYEVLRYSSLLPLGLHHRALVDLTFHDYFIPKDTMVLANLYAVHHEKDVWIDPENFRPERWLPEGENEENGCQKSVKMLKQEHFLPFSTGKRSCVGEILAKAQLFLYITTIFQRYTVTFPGDIVPPMTSNAVAGALAPTPFDMVFRARGLFTGDFDPF